MPITAAVIKLSLIEPWLHISRVSSRVSAGPVSLVKNIKKEKRKKDPPKTNKQTKPLKVRQCMLAALSNDLHCFVLIKISAFFFNRLSFLILFPNASRSSFVSGVARGFIEFEVPGLSFVLNWPARAGGVGGGGGGGGVGRLHSLPPESGGDWAWRAAGMAQPVRDSSSCSVNNLPVQIIDNNYIIWR